MSDFWDKLTSTAGKVGTALQSVGSGLNAFDKNTETAEEISYYRENGLSYPVSGVISTTAKGGAGSAAPAVAPSGPMAAQTKWMIGLGAAGLLFTLVLFFRKK